MRQLESAKEANESFADVENPLVSVICVTYNHEAYIERTLNGFVSQITNFPFEVIVADDCSTDSNQKIIREFADRYQAIIKPILQTKNIGSNSNYFDAVSRAKGEFIATCDGDDYWTDDKKLQKQVDFLNLHSDFAMCCHPFVECYSDGSRKERTLSPWQFVSNRAKERGFLTIDDLVPLNPIGSVSVMYRWSLVQELPEWTKEYPVADLIMHFLHADKGKIGVMDDVMAVYNRHPNGVWFNNDQIQHQEKLAKAMADMFIDIDYELENRHTDVFQPLKGPNLKILFLAIENSIHSYKWISAVANESRFEIQVFSTFKIQGHPDLFNNADNIKIYKSGDISSLKEVIEEFQPDIIHTLHTQLSAYPILNIKIAHDSIFPIWINSIWGSDLSFWMKDRTQNKKLRSLLKHVDYIVGEGKRDEELADDLGFTGKFLGPLPASAGIEFSKLLKIPYFPPSQRKEISVKGYDRGVGRFRDALVALIRLKNDLKDYRINVYSMEMDPAMLDIYARDSGLNIRIISQSDNNEMLELFSRSRIAIACSYSDGLPGSLLEAMASGAFPIQTDTAITEGWVSHGKTALLVPPDDVNALVDTIRRALTDDKLVDDAASINRETIRMKADITKQRRSIEELYNSVAFEKNNRLKALRESRRKVNNMSGKTLEITTLPTTPITKTSNLFIKLKQALRIMGDVGLVRKSGFFDAKWYLTTYPDVKKAKVDPLVHYLRHGAFEGRNPSLYFDSKWYLSNYMDVYIAGINPLVHFLRFGRFENRTPKQLFKTS